MTHTHSILIHSVLPALLLAGALWCLLATPSLAASTVTNSVHISTGGTGQSYSSVTTIVNGEVVEDWSASSTEPIHYEYTYGTKPVPTTETGVQVDSQIGMIELIARLQALIHFYELLLAS